MKTKECDGLRKVSADQIPHPVAKIATRMGQPQPVFIYGLELRFDSRWRVGTTHDTMVDGPVRCRLK